MVLFSEDLEVASPAVSVKAPQSNSSRLLSIQRVDFFSKLPMGFRCTTLLYLRGAVILSLNLKAELYLYIHIYIPKSVKTQPKAREGCFDKNSEDKSNKPIGNNKYNGLLIMSEMSGWLQLEKPTTGMFILKQSNI